MLKFAPLLLTLGGVFALAPQGPVPAPLASNAKTLLEGGALTAAFTVTPIGGASAAYTLKYSKPNLLRIDSPDGFVQSDGKDVYIYTKASNDFTVTPLSDAGLLGITGADEVWGWLAFFAKEPFKGFKTVQVGGKRTIKGNPVSEFPVTLAGDVTGTIYVDAKLGIVRGFAIKNSKKDLLVMATEIEVGKDPADPAAFAFVAPQGAKKAEPKKVADVPFSKVQTILNNNCMPCHSSGSRSGGMDFSSYEGVSRAVRPGEPDQSRIVREVVSGRMPQGRPKLSNTDIETIKGWIAAGAKNP